MSLWNNSLRYGRAARISFAVNQRSMVPGRWRWRNKSRAVVIARFSPCIAEVKTCS